MKTKLKFTCGKFRRYTCECGEFTSVIVPAETGNHACECGKLLRELKFTVEDRQVFQRMIWEGKR